MQSTCEVLGIAYEDIKEILQIFLFYKVITLHYYFNSYYFTKYFFIKTLHMLTCKGFTDL